jgi:hypothetical protein
MAEAKRMTCTRLWRYTVGICALLASGATASAQSPESTTSREVVSATGCLARPGIEGSGGAAPAGSAAEFVLTGVRVAPAVGLVEAPRTASPDTPSSHEGSQATNTPDVAGSVPSGDAGATSADIARRDPGLLLVPDRGVDLVPHVGHRVMVTGRLSSFAAVGGVASASSGRTLTVTRVTLIAPACTTGS